MKKASALNIGLKVLFSYMLAMILMAGCDSQTSETRTNLEAGGMQEENIQQSETGANKGGQPWVINIEQATINNPNYRNTQWTGQFMQMVLMSLKPGEEIDLEMHDDVDQFIRIEQGEARVRMGKSQKDLSFDEMVSDDWAVFIPAGYYHHVRNIGDTELKLYSIYAPKEHAAGTVHKTYQEAKEDHHD
jgi:mannose-6-phosphate isomerase-like protein (cupin superfamily)